MKKDATATDTRAFGVQWEMYAMGVLQANSPAIQYEECRRAFYAGAAALFYTMNTLVSPGTGDATAEDMKLMEGISNELVEFGKETREFQKTKAEGDRERNLYIERTKPKPI